MIPPAVSEAVPSPAPPSSGPVVQVSITPSESGGPPGARVLEAVVATADWAVRCGAVRAVGGPGLPEVDPSPGGDVWSLEIGAGVYPSPTMLAHLVRALSAGGGGVAGAREIPLSSGAAPCRLVRPGDGDTVEAGGAAVAFRDRRLDGDGPGVDRFPPFGAVTRSPFLTVVLRTQGRRPVNLEEALTCLAAQTTGDFEVQLAVHDPEPGVFAAVEQLQLGFAASFAKRVHPFTVVGGGRARPLNAALERANGAYVAFLDDDDVVTADWVEVFAAAAARTPGRVVRSIAVTQRVSRTDDGSYTTVGTPQRVYPPRFDLIEHLHENATPIFSYAVPLGELRRAGEGFCEDLPVLEDWDFLLRCALASGVTDTDRATGIYHWWESGESALDQVPVETWQEARRRVMERLGTRPISLPPGSAIRLAELMGELRQARTEAAALRHELAQACTGLDAIRRSRSWRVTAPLRWLSDRFRR